MINIIQNALSGLVAATKRVEGSASNIANVTTAGSIDDPENQPYRALQTIQESNELGGVRAELVEKQPAFVPAFDQNSPFANEDGVIGVPNINLAEEAVNLNLADIAFKANVKVLETVNELNEELLSVFDKEV